MHFKDLGAVLFLSIGIGLGMTAYGGDIQDDTAGVVYEEQDALCAQACLQLETCDMAQGSFDTCVSGCAADRETPQSSIACVADGQCADLISCFEGVVEIDVEDAPEQGDEPEQGVVGPEPPKMPDTPEDLQLPEDMNPPADPMGPEQVENPKPPGPATPDAPEDTFSIDQVLVVASEQCPEGYRHVEYEEAQAHQEAICRLLGPWYIARLAGGGSMDGSGYNCKIRPSDARGLGHSICVEDDAAPTPHQCFWMENDTGEFNWIPTEEIGLNDLTQQECFELDSCNGGLGYSGGGCYKWASSADAEHQSWE